MTETHPTTGSFHSSLLLTGERRISELEKAKPTERVLTRVDGKDLGLVGQESPFFVKEAFVKKKDGGYFIDLPDILFNEKFFYQITKGALPEQFGEYDAVEKTEIQMLRFAQREGFDLAFSLSQIYAVLMGGWNGTYDTVNKESVPYLFPVESRQGLMIFQVMRYHDGFLPLIEKPGNKKLYRAKYLARYQKLQDPLEFLRRY